jgi:hypothetical protein
VKVNLNRKERSKEIKKKNKKKKQYTDKEENKIKAYYICTFYNQTGPYIHAVLKSI